MGLSVCIVGIKYEVRAFFGVLPWCLLYFHRELHFHSGTCGFKSSVYFIVTVSFTSLDIGVVKNGRARTLFFSGISCKVNLRESE